eukprot:697777-Amphidinium_carterae.1
MACYYLVHPETSADMSPDVLPHPAMLGNYILAADASLSAGGAAFAAPKLTRSASLQRWISPCT